MEFGARELVQFGMVLASLAGAFAVVKSQLARVLEDLKGINKEMETFNVRLDAAESERAVFKSKLDILAEINSVKTLEKRNREVADIQARLKVNESQLKSLSDMHNGTHPVSKGK
tara:strand:- start:1292 stop:1636 length:345 start_codon:yes stop_codon:yes gene_type:complete